MLGTNIKPKKKTFFHKNQTLLQRLSKDAEKIAIRAGLMIDKLVGLKDDFKKIKSSFNATQDALDQAEKKLSTGKGNLTNQAKELQDMGARSKKVLSDFDND